MRQKKLLASKPHSSIWGRLCTQISYLIDTLTEKIGDDLSPLSQKQEKAFEAMMEKHKKIHKGDDTKPVQAFQNAVHDFMDVL